MKLFKSKRLISVFFFLLFIIPPCLFLGMYSSYDVNKLEVEYPHIQRHDSEVDYVIKKDRPKYWVRLKEISPYLKGAIILSEDWGFYQHEGVDIEQIKIAALEMYKENKFRGASTITQQMVKNIYLSQSRTIWRKIYEIVLAYKVEKYLSKGKILEIYLNSIEYGPNIYGIRDASYYYFKKHPSALSPKESAYIAMLLPSPKRYSISFRKKKLTSFSRKRVHEILVKMRMGKIISMDQYQSEMSTKLSWEND